MKRIGTVTRLRRPGGTANVSSAPWPGNRPDSTASGKRVLVLPGSGYTVDFPVLYWCCRALAWAGWHVEAVTWRVPREAQSDPLPFVESAAAAAEASAPPAPTTLVLAKSFGTYAAAWANRQGYAGVWLTPVLTDPELARALTQPGLPGLIVGGSADRLWNRAAAQRSGRQVLEVPGANHAMEVPGDRGRSLAALERLVERVEDFAATVR